MATRCTDAFRRDAVRIAISSGLTLAPSHTCFACVAGQRDSRYAVSMRGATL
ncbi:MAG: hypothetical protein ACI9ND_003358 [Yoonia sp.]|jgi:hypothetical protein